MHADNLPLFTDCLGIFSAVIENSDVEIALIVGDFNDICVHVVIAYLLMNCKLTAATKSGYIRMLKYLVCTQAEPKAYFQSG